MRCFGILIFAVAHLFISIATHCAPVRVDGGLGETAVGFSNSSPRFIVAEQAQKVVYLANGIAPMGPYGGNEVFSANLDGTSTMKYGITGSHSDVINFRLSPDESHIVFRNPAGLWSVPLIGGTPERLDSSEERALDYAINTTSTHVVFGDMTGFYSAPIGGGPINDLVNLPFTGFLQESIPNLSPDGNFIIYKFTETADNDSTIPHLIASPIIGGPSVDLAAGPGNLAG